MAEHRVGLARACLPARHQAGVVSFERTIDHLFTKLLVKGALACVYSSGLGCHKAIFLDLVLVMTPESMVHLELLLDFLPLFFGKYGDGVRLRVLVELVDCQLSLLWLIIIVQKRPDAHSHFDVDWLLHLPIH